jgi:transketolase
MFAAQNHLDNLVALVDYNKVQALGHSKDVLDLEPLDQKMKDFHWGVKSADGHDVVALDKALQKLPIEKGKPSIVLCHTVKGKGVSWMEDTVSCHYGSVNDQQLAQALRELGVNA